MWHPYYQIPFLVAGEDRYQIPESRTKFVMSMLHVHTVHENIVLISGKTNTLLLAEKAL